MKIKVNKRKRIEFLLYIIAILTIYSTGSVITSMVGNETLGRTLVIMLVVLCVPFVLWCIRVKRVMRQMMIVALAIAFYWVMNALHYAGSINHMTLRFVLFLALFCMAKYNLNKEIDFYKVLYNVIIVLAVFALVIFILTTLLGRSIPYSEIQYGNITYRDYFGIYYVANVYYIDFLWMKIYRLQSLFWEPGVYAIFLNLALYYFVFLKKEKNKWQLAVILISIIFTVSTTGIIVGMVLFAIYMLSNKSYRRFRIVMVLPIAAITAAGVSYVWLQKKVETGRRGLSYALRMSDIQVGMKLFVQHPLIGTGYNNTQIFTVTQGFNRGSSNGLITWLYTMGLIGTVIAFYPFITNIFRQKDKSKKIAQIVFLAVFIAITLTEPIQVSPIILYFVAYEYASLRW